MPELRNEWTKNGGTPEHCLRMAAARGEMQLLRKAIRVALLDDADERGRSAMHAAAESGHVEVCRTLVIAGADKEVARARAVQEIGECV